MSAIACNIVGCEFKSILTFVSHVHVHHLNVGNPDERLIFHTLSMGNAVQFNTLSLGDESVGKCAAFNNHRRLRDAQ